MGKREKTSQSAGSDDAEAMQLPRSSVKSRCMRERIGMKDRTLFSKSPKAACLTYTNLWNAKNNDTQAGRKHCEDLWNDFSYLADDHFLDEFPLRTHQRWFEMYLAVSLKRAGLSVECPKSKKNGAPDVMITKGDKKIWIEAVCVTAGEESKPDSVPPYPKAGKKPVATHLPEDQMVLRLRSSLRAKECQYRKYLTKGIVSQDDVLAVAINVHDLPHGWHQMETLMKGTLYGVGNVIINCNIDTNEVNFHHKQRTSILKKSGGKIPVRPFIDCSMPHIAAVLGSSSDMVNLPRRLGDDFALFPNLSCEMAWPEGSIKLGEEWVFREVDGEWKEQKISHCEQ